MIDLHFWPTPNGLKITIALEETGLPYRIVPVNIGRGDQFKPEFLAISPNNRMPAIVDDEPLGGGPPLSIFESGAILTYIAEKSGQLTPRDLRGRYEVAQWVAWQIANLGPVAGNFGHFASYASEKIPYAIDRFTKELNRLYGVLNRRLSDRDYLAGDYSIADIAAWPWISPERQGQNMAEFPHVARWHAAIGARPAVQRGKDVGKELRQGQGIDEDAKKILFGQTAASVGTSRR